MVSCVYPGSFDPVTKGHMDLIARAADLFDHVTVTVMVNVNKIGTIPVEKRLELMRTACSSYPNVSVEYWEGLLADYMSKKKERIIIRGIRDTTELEAELRSSCANHMLNDRIETVFLPADPSMTGISSSAVREIAAFGGDIRAFVPEIVSKEITDCLSNNINRK